ncbi:hypothetical protein ASE23_00015 [Rhizobium sp. Root73]|uniref:hypothetical protein n=1 Tax=unclassified Rhizobium TaxID=2613769 RepID=UPI00072B306B|nr:MULTISPECIES: hypothetical protein [unclassified Rhizobium]KQY17094.1 hypothetical protein ASD36_00015 [Rhizobium sp. Root1334]KRC12994.1 hypothetical protein ASE23_00015 [Rhizobium sp. Root73]
MMNKEKIEAFADDYTAAVIDFYKSKRNAGITPTNSEILVACPIPKDLGNIESEAFFIIVTVTKLVDADLTAAPVAKDVSSSKSTGDEWARRRARLAEIETKATDSRRRARIAQLRADNAAAARKKAADLKMAEHLEQSRQRQAVAAERAKLYAQLAAQEKVRMQSFPIPRG